MKTKLICFLCDTVRKAPYTLCSCALVDFPASDANPVHPPLAELCVPCVPSDTETEKQPPQSQFPQNHPSPLVAPSRPRVAGFHPRWGTTRPSPVRGRFGPHRGKFGRSHRRSREAGKPFSFFCFSQAGNKTHRSLKPTHSSLLGRASRAPARRCRSAQKAGRSRLPARSARGGPHRGPSPLHPLCRKERSL